MSESKLELSIKQIAPERSQGSVKSEDRSVFVEKLENAGSIFLGEEEISANKGESDRNSKGAGGQMSVERLANGSQGGADKSKINSTKSGDSRRGFRETVGEISGGSAEEMSVMSGGTAGETTGGDVAGGVARGSVAGGDIAEGGVAGGGVAGGGVAGGVAGGGVPGEGGGSTGVGIVVRESSTGGTQRGGTMGRGTAGRETIGETGGEGWFNLSLLSEEINIDCVKSKIKGRRI